MSNKRSALAENSVAGIDCCPVMATLGVIGGKWKPAILYQLVGADVLRFGELKNRLSGITQKMLTQQLRELETEGVIRRKVYAEVPPRVEYSLTDYGRSLSPILDAMAHWGIHHQNLVAKQSA